MDGIPAATMPKMDCAWVTMPSWRSRSEISRANSSTEGRTRYLVTWIALDLRERPRQRPPRTTKETQQNCEPQRQYSPPLNQPERAASSVADASHADFSMEPVQRLLRVVRGTRSFCLAGDARRGATAL